MFKFNFFKKAEKTEEAPVAEQATPTMEMPVEEKVPVQEAPVEEARTAAEIEEELDKSIKEAA